MFLGTIVAEAMAIGCPDLLLTHKACCRGKALLRSARRYSWKSRSGRQSTRSFRHGPVSERDLSRLLRGTSTAVSDSFGERSCASLVRRRWRSKRGKAPRKRESFPRCNHNELTTSYRLLEGSARSRYAEFLPELRGGFCPGTLADSRFALQCFLRRMASAAYDANQQQSGDRPLSMVARIMTGSAPFHEIRHPRSKGPLSLAPHLTAPPPTNAARGLNSCVRRLHRNAAGMPAPFCVGRNGSHLGRRSSAPHRAVALTSRFGSRPDAERLVPPAGRSGERRPREISTGQVPFTYGWPGYISVGSRGKTSWNGRRSGFPPQSCAAAALPPMIWPRTSHTTMASAACSSTERASRSEASARRDRSPPSSSRAGRRRAQRHGQRQLFAVAGHSATSHLLSALRATTGSAPKSARLGGTQSQIEPPITGRSGASIISLNRLLQ